MTSRWPTWNAPAPATVAGETHAAGSSLPVATPPPPTSQPVAEGAAAALAGQAVAAIDLRLIETEMQQFLAWRLAELGPDGSGLGAYYARQITSGQVFNDGDTMLLKVLPYNFLDYGSVVEVGAGFGQLGLALGILGRKVVCIEADAGRYACMAALKAWLETKYIQLADHVTLLKGTWPRALGLDDPSRALLIACDFVFTPSGDSEGEAIEALKAYGGAVIDASHFVLSRLTPGERLKFYTRIAEAGLPVPAKLPPHRNSRESEFIFVSKDASAA